MIRDFATIPAVDVLDGRAVRLLRGDYDRIELDAGDPLELVRRAASYAPPPVPVGALRAARGGPGGRRAARARAVCGRGRRSCSRPVRGRCALTGGCPRTHRGGDRPG